VSVAGRWRGGRVTCEVLGGVGLRCECWLWASTGCALTLRAGCVLRCLYASGETHVSGKPIGGSRSTFGDHGSRVQRLVTH